MGLINDTTKDTYLNQDSARWGDEFDPSSIDYPILEGNSASNTCNTASFNNRRNFYSSSTEGEDEITLEEMEGNLKRWGSILAIPDASFICLAYRTP